MRAYMAIYGGSNGACMRAYMAIYGGSNGACIRAYMAIYGGIYGPYGSSNGACIRAYIGHIWGQPYRESREEGNNKESLPFPRPGKGITLSLSLPFPSPSSREGKGRENNPYFIPQRKYGYYNNIKEVLYRELVKLLFINFKLFV